MPELRPGTDLANRYEIRQFLAGGGFGEVYRAVDRRLEVEVALKILRAEARQENAQRDGFLAEARRQAQFRDHPHVITIHDVEVIYWDDGPFPFLTMEWLAGGTLHQRIPRDGAEPQVPAVKEWVAQVADALDAASRRGFLHRDVKPGNVLLDDYGRAHLGDFGLARVLEQGRNQVSRAIGTQAYMAPEVFRAGREVTAAADVFALGVTLWVLLTGTHPLPYGGQNLLTPGSRAPSLRGTWSRAPVDLNDLVARMLDPDPSRRPAAGEVRDLLRGVMPEMATVGITLTPGTPPAAGKYEPASSGAAGVGSSGLQGAEQLSAQFDYLAGLASDKLRFRPLLQESRGPSPNSGSPSVSRGENRFRVGSSVVLELEVARPSHLVVIDLGSGGTCYCLCPSEFAPRSHLPPGAYRLPQPGSEFEAFDLTGGAGRERLIAVLSDTALGLAWEPSAGEPAREIGAVDLEELLERLRERSPDTWTVLTTFFDAVE